MREFLRDQWRYGALLGRTEDKAFYVRCGRTTMTQDDINRGLLVCGIGIAPVRAGEFATFRLLQHSAEAGDGSVLKADVCVLPSSARSNHMHT
jgi:phage tail sheath protein FI